MDTARIAADFMVARGSVGHNVTPEMRRRALVLTLAVAAESALAAGLAGTGCRAFELGDVVPLEDGAANDGDGAAGRDGASSCAGGDGDPCACLPTPETILAPPHGVGVDLLVVGGDAYFLASGIAGGTSDPALFRAPVTGLAPGADPVRVMVASPVSPPMVYAAGSIFVRRIGTSVAVMRVPAAGVDATPTVFGSVLPPGLAPADLGTDGTAIYWPNSAGALCTLRADGTPPAPDTVDSGCGGAPIVPPRDGGASGPNQIALAPNALFWAWSTRTIAQVPLPTGAPITTFVSQSGLTSLQANEGNVFWSQIANDAGTLWSAPTSGGSPTPVLPSPIDGRAVTPAYVVDHDGIWWGQKNWDRVMTAARDGSNRRLVACEPGVAALATDADYVYWLTTNGGVRRLRKK